MGKWVITCSLGSPKLSLLARECLTYSDDFPSGHPYSAGAVTSILYVVKDAWLSQPVLRVTPSDYVERVAGECLSSSDLKTIYM